MEILLLNWDRLLGSYGFCDSMYVCESSFGTNFYGYAQRWSLPMADRPFVEMEILDQLKNKIIKCKKLASN